ncbi:D-alanyl-D-alanine carboxypeptidase [Streptomyces sp. PsTaAH-130]|uniref:D-alanyl-D-alanine carboxypeptidase n=1 Tax=unclassified Streptomyces TaxID=2593676 RepID=UPI000DC40B4B|nr:D-alanyl-D-alanine carboxypeptidase [Streptomyces sp. PsTaAH-130]RAJ58434.1 D-alanyl-D-alanine carboxypeptidase [Streptomyces sp. PsTaAH-130]
MAGESPDRSKQRESSAGATSGRADAVPEARDPRIAVARGGSGGSAGAGAGQKDSSNGGTDTATKVFRTPAVEEDTDLRDAVSSWVRDADEPEAPTDAPAKDAEGAGAAEADASAEGDADPKGDAKGATGAISDGASGSGAGSEAADDEAGADADAKATAEDGDAEPDAGSGAKGDAGTKDDAADAGAEAGDAEAEGARKTPETGTGDAEAKDDADAQASTGEAAVAAAARAKAAAETADAEAEALADDAAAKAGAGAEAAAAKNAANAKTGAQPKADAGAKAATAAEADADAKDGTGADAKADAGPKSDAEAGRGAEAGAEAKADDGPAADDESRTGDAGGETAEGEAEATTEAAAVDQPTAIFKAVHPKDQVDQPTTMLKVGEGGTKQTESEAERTSKFVALKDDVRHKPKPKATPAPAPADETTAVPQVGPERTTQQPLPPKPPLDLLAELTNTPPPPETPVRTAVRRVKIWTPLVLLLVIVFAVVQTLRPLPSPTLALTAKDSYTFDGGRVNLPWPGEGQGWMDGDGIGTMGNFGKQTPVAIGSVAKTMTAYIILRDHPLKPGQEGQKIKVDATAEKEGGYNKSGESTLNTVHAGDSLTEKQALSAVMIPSANNIARLLARWDAGSEAAFVKKMNATAQELGMTGTTYTDPSGLKETTVSTAQDQVKLGRAVVKIPALVAITSAASWTDPTGQNWPNYNSLPYWIGAIGIKTGTTTAAGGNLLFAARKKVGGQTVTVVGAILGQHKPSILDTVNEVSKTALLGATHALTSAKILKKGDVVGYVDDQLGGQTPIVVTEDVTAVGWSGLKVKLSFASDTVPHTAKAGTRVGTLTVGDGTTAGVKVPVALQRNLAEPGFGAKLTRIG